jgi:surfeit locus 1 family protein
VTRRLLWPTLITAAMLAVLLALGTWQLHRRTWKLAILAAIDAAEQAPPAPLGPHPAPFAKVEVRGRLHADLAARYGIEARPGPDGTVLGSQLIVPLLPPQGPPVLVDLGWLPAQAHPPLPAGPVSIQGYVREPSRPGWFTPADEPAARQFYALDPARIGAALGLPAVAPFTVVAMGPAGGAAGVPDPAQHLPRPPNDHLQYALTWYGLAAILAFMFATYVAKGPRA